MSVGEPHKVGVWLGWLDARQGSSPRWTAVFSKMYWPDTWDALGRPKDHLGTAVLIK
jgi:hypothetical protein